MGNKNNNTKPLKKTQAKQALQSGESHSGVAGRDKLVSIKIKLIRLNLSTLSQITLYETVIVRWRDDAYYCLFSGEILGKVPGNYNNQLLAPANHNAVIVEVNQQPPTVIVEIHI